MKNFIRHVFYLPKLFAGKNSVASLATQASTLTKSATNDGILHFNTAVLPLITYSETTSAS